MVHLFINVKTTTPQYQKIRHQKYAYYHEVTQSTKLSLKYSPQVFIKVTPPTSSRYYHTLKKAIHLTTVLMCSIEGEEHVSSILMRRARRVHTIELLDYVPSERFPLSLFTYARVNKLITSFKVYQIITDSTLALQFNKIQVRSFSAQDRAETLQGIAEMHNDPTMVMTPEITYVNQALVLQDKNIDNVRHSFNDKFFNTPIRINTLGIFNFIQNNEDSEVQLFQMIVSSPFVDTLQNLSVTDTCFRPSPPKKLPKFAFKSLKKLELNLNSNIERIISILNSFDCEYQQELQDIDIIINTQNLISKSYEKHYGAKLKSWFKFIKSRKQLSRLAIDINMVKSIDQTGINMDFYCSILANLRSEKLKELKLNIQSKECDETLIIHGLQDFSILLTQIQNLNSLEVQLPPNSQRFIHKMPPSFYSLSLNAKNYVFQNASCLLDMVDDRQNIGKIEIKGQKFNPQWQLICLQLQKKRADEVKIQMQLEKQMAFTNEHFMAIIGEIDGLEEHPSVMIDIDSDRIGINQQDIREKMRNILKYGKMNAKINFSLGLKVHIYNKRVYFFY